MAKQTNEVVVKTNQDLRKMLLETIRDVKLGTLDYRAASAISGLTTKVLQSAKLDLDVMKFERECAKTDTPETTSRKTLQLVSGD